MKWHKEPKNHDYPAAEEYLSLLYSRSKAKKLVKRLQNSNMVAFKAKDIFRASGLPHLGRDNFHVKKNLIKIKRDEELSPILLVRDISLVIADGYHRLCAVYIESEDERIPCKLADANNI